MRWPQRVAFALFLALLLTCPPVVLARFVGWPIQDWPSSQQTRSLMAQPLTEQTLTIALALLAWLVWLLLVGTVVIRLIARLRAGARWVRQMPLPTPMQATASGIAGVAVLGVSANTTTPQSDTPPPTAAETLDHPSSEKPGNQHDQSDSLHRSARDGLVLAGGWVPQSTAEQIAAAGALVWLRRRRSYRPDPSKNPSHDDSDLTPLPATVTAVQAALAPSPSGGPNAGQPVPTSIEQTTGRPRDTQSLSLADLPTAGLSLTGPGAADAARGMLITALLAGLRHPRTPSLVRLITTTPDITMLLGVTDPWVHDVPGLHLADSVQDAVALLEAQPHQRPQPDSSPSHTDPPVAVPDDPLILLIQTPTTSGAAARLTAALRDRDGDTIAVLLGAWPQITTWHVEVTGHSHDVNTPNLAGPRLCVLDAIATTDLLTVISHTQPTQANAHRPPQSKDPQPAPRTVIPRQAPGYDTSPTKPTANPQLQRWKLRILGVPALLCDGQTVSVRRSAAMQALVFLAVHRQGATSRQLTEAIWPGVPAHTVTGRLYTTLSELRATIRAASGPDIVHHHHDRYQLAQDHLDVDLWRLQAAADEATTALVDRSLACQAVVDGYTGELATQQPWPWLDAPRELTRRLVIDAYAVLAAEQHDPHHTLTLLQDAIRVDPLNEDLHRQAVHALAALGNHAAVQELLDNYHRRLTTARLEPNDDLRRMAAQLR
ncbi:BTAD domain-containing putative transcriptional regulator [Micromonospora sp. NPDC050397]|uniref:AfsR/SARP family transcriptional regulator n=1 Tax=Micromonospora sp. NPDC050397 TaxID=3364279 RepID=UPI00384D1875